MSGAFKAVGDVVGGVAKGVTKSVGGVLKGAGQVLTGHPIEGLKTAVGGVVQGSASVVKGGLGAVKDVTGDPLLMGAAGLATFGIGGAVAAPLIGKLGSSIAGNAEQTVGQTFGLDGQQQMMTQYNQSNYGEQNAYIGGNIGGLPPTGGPGMMGQPLGFEQSGGFGLPGSFGQPGGLGQPPMYGAAPGATSFA